MGHSVLDGTTGDAFPDAGDTVPPTRTRVGACMSRPAVAVTPRTDFATVVAAITASDLLAAYAAERVPGDSAVTAPVYAAVDGSGASLAAARWAADEAARSGASLCLDLLDRPGFLGGRPLQKLRRLALVV
ncbi:hypothetical protein ABZ885_40395, partial [Kitasatospora sp. NPDC047058]